MAGRIAHTIFPSQIAGLQIDLNPFLTVQAISFIGTLSLSEAQSSSQNPSKIMQTPKVAYSSSPTFVSLSLILPASIIRLCRRLQIVSRLDLVTCHNLRFNNASAHWASCGPFTSQSHRNKHLSKVSSYQIKYAKILCHYIGGIGTRDRASTPGV